jgi:hypothetical protein
MWPPRQQPLLIDRPMTSGGIGTFNLLRGRFNPDCSPAASRDGGPLPWQGRQKSRITQISGIKGTDYRDRRSAARGPKIKISVTSPEPLTNRFVQPRSAKSVPLIHGIRGKPSLLCDPLLGEPARSDRVTMSCPVRNHLRREPELRRTPFPRRAGYSTTGQRRGLIRALLDRAK